MPDQIKKQTLACLEVNPRTSPKGCIIWMHGLGARNDNFVDVIPQLGLADKLGVRFVFPQAPNLPVTINNGYIMPAWFDIFALTAHHPIDYKGIETSIQAIHALIEAEIANGIPADKIILAGFSQGSVIALGSALSFPNSLGGIIVLSGFLPEAEFFIEKTQPANKKIPIFVAHGTQDTVLPLVLGQNTAHILTKYNFPVTWKSYVMPHTVCLDEVVDLGKWISERLS